MTEPTPGPWRAENGWPVVHATGTLNIADCHKARQFRMSNCIPKNEQEANARLIAAAPDLLEALQRAVTELRTAQSFYEQSGDAALAGMAAVAVQIGVEAIAKAEPHRAKGQIK